jgi:hypothetical protein
MNGAAVLRCTFGSDELLVQHRSGCERVLPVYLCIIHAGRCMHLAPDSLPPTSQRTTQL